MLDVAASAIAWLSSGAGDLTAWLNTNAGAVQAIFTVALILVTAWYAKTTRDQLGEAIAARQQALMPYIQVTDFSASVTVKDGKVTSFGARFDLANTGPGPALGVTGFLRDERMGGLVYTFGHAFLASNERLKDFGVLLQTVHFREELFGQDFPTHVWIEYRDLLGRWWATRYPVKLEIPKDGSSKLTYWPQEQTVEGLKRPTFWKDKKLGS